MRKVVRSLFVLLMFLILLGGLTLCSEDQELELNVLPQTTEGS